MNIGCGEGYYAVGLARLMPATRVVAFDSAPEAQQLCRQLAEANSVADRVEIRGSCGVSELRELTQRKCLILCDCEGGETTLLDPDQIPGLWDCDILVELHEFLDPQIPEQVIARFSATYEVTSIANGARNAASFPILHGLPEIDQMLASYEGRPGPTPWAFLRLRAPETI